MKKIIYLILIGSILSCSLFDKKEQKEGDNKSEPVKQEPVKQERTSQEPVKQNNPPSEDSSSSSKLDLSDPDIIRHDIKMIDPKSDLLNMQTQLKYIKQRRILAEKRAKEAETSYQKSMEEERKSVKTR
ncbi:MAG: hypothetical protein H7A23_07640 [Leptospiraceae bacterium]|nr:hypothetical protein [Leptospiraceae bacterium]MCP5494414.1 hypothetical protein [Leptospiraceae bacterium]